MSLLDAPYDSGTFFDEMFASGNGAEVRTHYRLLVDRLRTLPVAEFDQRTAGSPPGDFAADVAALETLLGQIGPRDGGAPWPRHPIFGRMSQRAWLRWAYLHMDHHLRQFGA